MKSLISVGTILGAVAFAAPALAEGWYVGADIGRTKAGTVAPGAAMTKSTDTVGGVFLGYRLTPNFGLEGFYTGGGKFSETLAGKAGSGKTDIYGLDLVGTAPLSDNFGLYGRLGIANARTSASSVPAGLAGTNRSAATFGLGVEYDATPQVGIRFGWDRFGAAVANAGAKNNFNINTWSLGILLTF